MGDNAGNKRKSRLAVFEHLPSGNRKRAKRDVSPVSSSDYDLGDQEADELDFQAKQGIVKPRVQGVRLKEEPLKLKCNWDYCSKLYTDYEPYMEHVNNHVVFLDDDKHLDCLWENCDVVIATLVDLLKHISFHGYHTKLKNIGENMVERHKLPKCQKTESVSLADVPTDFSCDWEDCDKYFISINDYLRHVQVHVNATPKYCKNGEIIHCLWKGCKLRFHSQYKLIDHVRSHTRERVIACPTCGTMFATKTKFCDHRKRQQPVEQLSYQCSQCSKLFPTERLLRDHTRSHINHYKCNFCDMTCPSPSGLAKHIRYRHMNERPFKCNLCEHSCISKDHLDQHLTTHCDAKLVACDECNFRCRSLPTLERHYQKVHGNGVTNCYECHCCLKRFNRGNQLTKHLMADHGYHWPSGHSRFRYQEVCEGTFRLQMVRYESLEVTQEMIQSNSRRKEDSKKDPAKSYVLMTSENGEENVVCSTDKNVLITIADVDADGRVIHSETIESSEMKKVGSDEICLEGSS